MLCSLLHIFLFPSSTRLTTEMNEAGWKKIVQEREFATVLFWHAFQGEECMMTVRMAARETVGWVGAAGICKTQIFGRYSSYSVEFRKV